jgi:hypothetical protein
MGKTCDPGLMNAACPNYLLYQDLTRKKEAHQWRKNHARTRAVPVQQNRVRSFVRPVAVRQEQALPVPVLIRDAEESVNRSRLPDTSS